MKTHIIYIGALLLALLGVSTSAAQTAPSVGSEPSVPTDYTRLTHVYTNPQGNERLALTVDFPDASAPYAGEVNAWLVRLADNAFLPGDSYGGQPWDHAALGQFVARKFFRFAAKEVKHDSVVPDPYAYTYSMLVATSAPGFITYRLSSDLQLGDRRTMIGRQFVTYLYNAGEATNDGLFSHSRFKDVKKALLAAAYADPQFMQSRLVQTQKPGNANALRALFSPAGDDGWDGMVLPPAALTPQGVVFSYTSPYVGAQAKQIYHITVPYSAIRKCFTKEAQAAIQASYPLALAKN